MSSPVNMSKEMLKNELIAHNAPLPPSGAKKEVFVEMYEKHVLSNQKISRSEFSSDEEDPSKSPKLGKLRRGVHTSSKTSENPDFIVEGINISQLSDEELQKRLEGYGSPVGPIVASTRSVYERKLARLLKGQLEGEDIPNGEPLDEFSDSEEETHSRHSATPTTRRSTPRRTEVRHRRVSKESQDSPKKQNNVDRTSPRENFTRDTPTPRRSLRSNVNYNITETRKLYSNSLHSNKSEFNSNLDLDPVSSLASKVVEQVPEPLPPKKSRYSPLIYGVIALIIFALFYLVYINMEASEEPLTIDSPPPGKA